MFTNSGSSQFLKNSRDLLLSWWFQIIIIFCLLAIQNSLVSSFADAQNALNSSEETLKVLLANASNAIEGGNSSKAVQDLLIVQRQLALSNDSSSNQDSRLLIRETVGALLNNRPDIAIEILHDINTQLFSQLAHPPQNMTLEVPNRNPEKPRSITFENATNNVTSIIPKIGVLNKTPDNPNVTAQPTLNFTQPPETTTNGPASIRFLNFSNPIFGIKIQYPDSWSPRVYPYNNEGNNTIVGFYSPSKTASQLGNISGVTGQFVPYLDIFVFDSKNMSLEKIIDSRMKRIQNTTDVVIESKPFTLMGNHEAHKLVYSTITGGDEFFKKMQIYTIYNYKVYLITFTAQETLFSNYIPLIENMIDTFEVSNVSMS